MLSIFTPTENLSSLQSIINQEFRLNEVVEIRDFSELNGYRNFLIVQENEIKIPIRWSSEIPPYLFPNTIQFSKENLLAIVYFFLGNFEKAYEFSEKNPDLLTDIDAFNRLQHGIQQKVELDEKATLTGFEQYRYWHNTAILAHYAEINQFLNINHIKNYYSKAFDFATNDEYRAYTGKHLATLLLDSDELISAEKTLEISLEKAISDEATYELKNIQYGIWLKQLTMPYDAHLLEKIKTTLWEVLEYYEQKGDELQVAMLLIDASQIANISNSFAESLGYIGRAISILDDAQIPELLANAQYRKGVLLYTWAQNGNPQFFKPAMEAYQEALKVFNFDNTPEVFAEIQHHLGVIYSEIPDEAKKKSLWAAISVSSFNQALNFYTRETHPYEFAMICNSYGNALTKYPPSVKTDNNLKALGFYRQALEIRTAEEFPIERALTIMNFLEAAWYVSHTDEKAEKNLFTEMESLANEIKSLTDDATLQTDAQRHLERIAELKLVL